MKKIFRKAKSKFYFKLYIFGLSVYQMSFVSDKGTWWKLVEFVHKHYIHNEYHH